MSLEPDNSPEISQKSMMNFENILSLTSVKCSVATWMFPFNCRDIDANRKFSTWEERDEWLRWDAWDAEVIQLFVGMSAYRDAIQNFPLLIPTISTNLHRYSKWREFCANVTTPTKQQLLSFVEEIEHVHLDGAIQFPSLMDHVYWLVENVVINHLTKYDADLKELSKISIGIGRTIIMLGILIDGEYLRKDQAGKLLKKCLDVSYIGVPLEDLLCLEEFANLIDESPVDDSLMLIIDSVIGEESVAVEQFKSGKEKAIGAIIGKILKQVKSDPRIIKDIVVERLKTVV